MKASSIGAFDAKTHFSQLLDKVRHGAVYLITHRGRTVAELRPAQGAKMRFTCGCDKGRIWISPDFDEPLQEFKDYMR